MRKLSSSLTLHCWWKKIILLAETFLRRNRTLLHHKKRNLLVNQWINNKFLELGWQFFFKFWDLRLNFEIIAWNISHPPPPCRNQEYLAPVGYRWLIYHIFISCQDNYIFTMLNIQLRQRKTVHLKLWRIVLLLPSWDHLFEHYWHICLQTFLRC